MIVETEHAEYLEILEDSVAKADVFFKDTMPNMNVGDSFLSCDDITNWNEAALAIQRSAKVIRDARRAVSKTLHQHKIRKA